MGNARSMGTTSRPRSTQQAADPAAQTSLPHHSPRVKATSVIVLVEVPRKSDWLGGTARRDAGARREDLVRVTSADPQGRGVGPRDRLLVRPQRDLFGSRSSAIHGFLVHASVVQISWSPASIGGTAVRCTVPSASVAKVKDRTLPLQWKSMRLPVTVNVPSPVSVVLV